MVEMRSAELVAHSPNYFLSVEPHRDKEGTPAKATVRARLAVIIVNRFITTTP
jgi:hypothetical protein